MELLSNLLKDDYPILFEGLHTTAFLQHKKLKNRQKIIRLHNIEHQYYYQLFLVTSNIIHKLYYCAEYLKLKHYEKKVQYANALLPVSQSDCHYLSSRFSAINTLHTPAFHQYNEVVSKQGKGKYILLHGNLSIKDNYAFFTKNYSPIKNVEIIFAGKKPTSELSLFCQKHNIKLLENPSDDELFSLIQNAHINLIFSSINTGMKLKLLHSLYVGRFCFVNEEHYKQLEFKECVVSVNSQNLTNKIQEYLNIEFSTEIIQQRKNSLHPYNNNIVAQRIVKLI